MFILAVDDDDIFLDAFEDLVLAAGEEHVVTKATNASEAFDAMANLDGVFDCIFLDVNLVSVSGIDVCGAIRATPGYERHPILMLTASRSPSAVDAAFMAGATDFCTKPIDLEGLKLRLDAAEYVLDRVKGENRTGQASDPNHSLGRLAKRPALPRFVDRFAFDNYATRMSRGRQFGTMIFSVSVLNLNGAQSASVNSHPCPILTDVAHAISGACDSFAWRLFCYAGRGKFLCAFCGPTTFQRGMMEERIRAQLQTREGVDVSVGPASRLNGLFAVSRILRNQNASAVAAN